MSQLAALASQISSASSSMLAALGVPVPETTLTHVASGVAVSVVFAYLVKRVLTRPPLDGVPEPRNASLLWGHQRTAAELSVGAAFSMWMEELNSKVFKIRGALWHPDILIVSDPLAATHIMQKHVYDWPHSQIVRSRIERLLGRSLGWVEGESEHKRMRALVAPALGPEALRIGTPDVCIAAETLADNLKNHVTEHNGKCEISIVDWVNQATLEAIGRLGFGHDFGGGRSEDARNILAAWRSMSHVGISLPGFYAIALLRRFPLLARLPLKALRAQELVRRTIHEGVARELLRRNQAANLDSKGNDLLSRLISAHDSGKISTLEMMDHISMFIIAGSETTGQSLAYATWELARHPEIQAKLREEVMAHPGSPTYDELQTQLPYLDAVMRETFRMHPSAPTMERMAAKDDVLPLRHPIPGKNGKQITSIPVSPGQTVIMSVHNINRMDSIWGDGSNFRPERWMEELPQKDLCATGWSRLLTFSDGPRNCIGFRFAILQYKIILFTLIRRFKFEDTGVAIINKSVSSMQPLVVGEEDKGPRLPLKISFVENV